MLRLFFLCVICVCMFLSCSGGNSNMKNDKTIEEVEFVPPVDEKEHSEAPSMFDERYGTPIEGKEGKPKDDLVKDPNGEEIIGFDDGADMTYDDGGDYSEY